MNTSFCVLDTTVSHRRFKAYNKNMALRRGKWDVAPRWLFLIHQLPPKPDYLRVKIWRRLNRIGALPIKSSVYALPRTEAALEDFHWIRREITAAGGDATVCEARLVEGLADKEVEALFRAARDAEYARLAGEARKVTGAAARKDLPDESRRERGLQDLDRFRKRLAEIAALDFFGAPGRRAAERALTGLESRWVNRKEEKAMGGTAPVPAKRPRGRTWVTRTGIRIDRIASAWLIRRFIDPGARFKFVAEKGYRPVKGEIRFDMFEAEFTHEGNLCTFEVLLERFRLAEHALDVIAHVVHDIDLKDSRYDCPEAVGVDRLITGIAATHADDEDRLSRGSALFDDLYASFKGRKT